MGLRKGMERLTLREVRSLVRQALNEAPEQGYVVALDDIMDALMGADKKIELAHSQAPEGKARAVLVGLHQELLNQTSEFRKHIRQLRAMG